MERLNAYKIGFFTKRMNLSSAEAEKFWPVYNEYQDQKNRIQGERMGLLRTFNQEGNSMNDKQISEIGDGLIETAVKETELAVTFHNKLKAILPPVKVIRFYQAENQYKVALLNEIQNRKDTRPLQKIPDGLNMKP
jgi:hypothetical protein